MKNGVKKIQAAAYNNGRMVLLKCKAFFPHVNAKANSLQQKWAQKQWAQ